MKTLWILMLSLLMTLSATQSEECYQCSVNSGLGSVDPSNQKLFIDIEEINRKLHESFIEDYDLATVACGTINDEEMFKDMIIGPLREMGVKHLQPYYPLINCDGKTLIEYAGYNSSTMSASLQNLASFWTQTTDDNGNTVEPQIPDSDIRFLVSKAKVANAELGAFVVALKSIEAFSGPRVSEEDWAAIRGGSSESPQFALK